ncbi:transposase [Haloarcula sp. 1CSR25-25]|uniref:RNA-guided endonuclease InsQ/TnpB family protein n=1 Tax=Haloarcula sp. 1CSR25-25 TaxID=2862545 RepID=UPI002893B2DF|nr:transposase [Haloarcula sp. 1CSR25-25]MDT3435530.1 transposase [Haloarcula sp. 1CSR25-25]
MWYDYRFRAYPDRTGVTAEAERHIDIHRQAYNNTRYEYNTLNTDKDNIGSAYQHQKRLTEWKDEWAVFSEVHSKALQKTVERFYDNLSNLSEKKQNGHKVGWLKWKSPREYQSVTYSQSGFKLKDTSGRTATLWLSKIGDIPIRYHRPIPDNATVKEVTLKKETTGEWYLTFGIEVEDTALPEKPNVDDLDAEDCVGVDLGISNYIYTSDGDSVDWLNLSDEYDRLRREQRSLSRKEHGSNNWEKQRREVATVKRRIKRKVEDFQHKLTTWLVSTYDAVFVEDLNVSGMLQQRGNARNKQDAAWRGFIEMLEYKAELYGTHVVQVDSAGTTKECAECGVATEKPLWVREHSCPSCGFEADRDANASYNVLSRGLQELGLGLAEVTPAETAAAVETDGGQSSSIPASRVIETGSLGA